MRNYLANFRVWTFSRSYHCNIFTAPFFFWTLTIHHLYPAVHYCYILAVTLEERVMSIWNMTCKLFSSDNNSGIVIKFCVCRYIEIHTYGINLSRYCVWYTINLNHQMYAVVMVPNPKIDLFHCDPKFKTALPRYNRECHQCKKISFLPASSSSI